MIREEFQIQQQPVIVNHVFTLSRNDVIINAVNMADRLILDLDFNTLVGTSIEQIAGIQDSFWMGIANQIDKAIEHYKLIFE